jgi:DNA-binding NtrC family response regulator
LRAVTLALPPLRDRGNDVEVLGRHFLRLHAVRMGSLAEDFSGDALQAIRSYDWPGNVRELSHTIERAVLFADAPLILPVHLNLQPAEGMTRVAVEMPDATTIRLDFSENSPTLEELKYQIIQAAVKHSSHNLSRAARILGISRDAIRYRLERFRRRSGDAAQRRPRRRDVFRYSM